MPERRPAARTALACLGLVALAFAHAGPLAAQPAPDPAAALLLAGNKAFQERQYDQATARFREFLAKHATHKDAPAARSGLALTLLDGPQPKYQEARDLLRPLAADKAFADQAGALYHLGLAHRNLGLDELKQAQARPGEAAQRQAAARQCFAEAAPHFAGAVAAYAARVQAVPAAPAELPADAEWAARARCDQADAELRAGRVKEALATSAPFLKDAVLTRSRYRDLGRYHHGCAAFQLGDLKTAETTLTLLFPFADPAFGTHARYLLARTYHLADERAEAAVHYEGVLADFARHKQAAAEALQRPDLLKNDPAERSRVEALAKGPVPEHVGRAAFYHGVLLYEAGRFAEARDRFAELSKLCPQSPLLADARLRTGVCLVQSRDFPAAGQALEPLAGQEPRLADRALFWLARARVGQAPDPANKPARDQVLKSAIDTFRQAAARAEQVTAQDADARSRRSRCLLEMADTMHQVGQHREAAQVYAQLAQEQALPGRDAELQGRRATALHLAGAYDESDRVCQEFAAAYPQSVLLPAVLFRHAENAHLRAVQAEANPNLPNRAAELARLNAEAARRYADLLARCPGSPHANLARYGLALAHYRSGDFEKARAELEAIPAADRAGELAAAAYLLADCLLRVAPTDTPEDALAAGQLEDLLKAAAGQLEAFLASAPAAPETPAAMLRLGLCQSRMAELLAPSEEKTKLLAAARATYDRLLQPPLAQAPTSPLARLERAKVIALQGDPNGAVNELRQFTADPLRGSPVAPLAVVHLANLLRTLNRVPEAVDVLGKARTQYEGALAGDPKRKDWIPLLRHHHGLALRSAGKLKEARELFDLVVKQAPASPEALDAALRWGQCRREEGKLGLLAAGKLRLAAKNDAERAAAAKARDEAASALAEAVGFLEDRLKQSEGNDAAAATRARMTYEAAWGYRELTALEVEAARRKLAEETDREFAAVAPAQVPLQPAEQKARGLYGNLLDSFSDLPLATDAAFELAELLADRGEHEQALKYLDEALDREPAPELTERIRVRQGACLAARGQTAEALARFDAVAQNPKSLMAGYGHYGVAELLFRERKWADAVKRLAPVRDNPAFNNQPGLTDPALLKLGLAYAQLNDWNQSRQAYETLVNRFPSSPWLDEGRFGLAWAFQQLKQPDQAVNLYAQVTAHRAGEMAAEAQLQIGRCRLEQKRYAEAGAAFLVVPAAYDVPEFNAVALLEAAVCYRELGQPLQAERLLRRVARDFPGSPWAEAARARLAVRKAG